MSAIRYPFSPVEACVANVKTLPRVLGCTKQQVGMWRRYGLPWVAADRVAVALGFHPSTLWPSWFAPPNVDPDEASQAHSRESGPS